MSSNSAGCDLIAALPYALAQGMIMTLELLLLPTFALVLSIATSDYSVSHAQLSSLTCKEKKTITALIYFNHFKTATHSNIQKKCLAQKGHVIPLTPDAKFQPKNKYSCLQHGTRCLPPLATITNGDFLPSQYHHPSPSPS